MAGSMSLGLLELSLFNRDLLELLQQCREIGLDTELEREYNMGGDADLTDAAETLKASTFAERYKASAVRILMDYFRRNPEKVPRNESRAGQGDAELSRPVLYNTQASRYIPTLPIVPVMIRGQQEYSADLASQDVGPPEISSTGYRATLSEEAEASSREGSLEAPRKGPGETLREALDLVGSDLAPVTLEFLDVLGYEPAEGETWNSVEDDPLEKALSPIINFARIVVKARESTRPKLAPGRPALRGIRQSMFGMLMRSAYPEVQRVDPNVADLMKPFGIDVIPDDSSDSSEAALPQSSSGGMIDGVDEAEHIWIIPRSFSTRLEAEMIIIKSAITEYITR